MKYTNKELNVEILGANFFEIKERANAVDLIAGGSVAFRVFKNSTVEACNSSTVKAYGSSTVKAYGSSTVKAYGFSTVKAYGSSTVEACNSSTVEACNSSTVEAHDSSTVKAYNSSIVEAHDSSTVKAHDSSTVKAYNSSIVEACNSSTVMAFGFCCVFVKSVGAKIRTKNHFGAVIKQVFKTTKKTVVYKKLANQLIAELELDKGQVFQSEAHGKCRTNRVKVLKIKSIDGKKKYKEGISRYDGLFVYRVGKVVSAPYDKEVWECSTGIHFFLTREEAERYNR